MGNRGRRCLARWAFVAALVVALGALQGCVEWLKMVTPADKATDAFNTAIARLGTESDEWQQTMKWLEQQLVADGKKTLANEVTVLMQKGIATTGTELRCDMDFVRIRMKQDVERLLAKYQGKEVPPIEPALCQVVPEHVDMDALDQLSFYGYDLDAPKGIKAVLIHSGGEVDLTNWFVKPTHYLATLNLKDASAVCNKDGRRVALRYDGKTFSEVNVVRKECPKAPPPPAAVTQQHGETVYDVAGSTASASGVSEDRVYGTRCTPGFVRSYYQVYRTEGDGVCSATGVNPRNPSIPLGWVSPDPADCRVRVHYGVDWGWGHGVKCAIKMYEVSVPAPQQPDPPCGCW